MYDAIVIGSGIGSMTAAGLLAGVAGKKVLVLEKHTEPGGLTHAFRRDGATWDVGLHYVGEVEPGSMGRALFDYLSGGALRWNPMPEHFERFVYPGIDMRVPSSPRAYVQTLTDLFPEEARAIRRYFRDIRWATRWTKLGFAAGMVPARVAPFLYRAQQLTKCFATRTTAEVLAARFRSPKLRALLASQWGDYGLPPSQSAFAIHAQIVAHYLNGAWYPDGGAQQIARTFERGIEQAGGAILIAQEVLEIITREGKAVGVRVLDKRGAKPVERSYFAPQVISGAGAAITFEKLLPTEGEIGARTAAVRERIQVLRRENSLSAVTLYLRLKDDPACIGVQGENHWINTDFLHDDTEGQSRAVLQGSPRQIYVSFPSKKANDERFHTAEIIAFVESRAFAQWRERAKGERGAEYAVLKKQIADGLLKLADQHIAGLSALVTYSELSTPLTVEHYTSHPEGHFYGLAATPQRYRMAPFGPRTPIEELFLAGQDAGCLGIFGAMLGGVGAACQALGAKGFPMIKAALKKGAVHHAPATLHEQKMRAELIAKKALTPTIWELVFKVDGKIANFTPGQFARLNVGDTQWRDYSIAAVNGQEVRFLISSRTGGHGAQFVQNAPLGTKTLIALPFGHFGLTHSGRRQVFIATGTGLAPFLPMFAALKASGGLQDAVLFFGCSTLEQDITVVSADLPGRVVCCVTRSEPPVDGFSGRVTEALQDFEFAPDATDFYLCGASAMVESYKEVLQARGANYLFYENF
ncbi:MAG: FAD-dependent oxidoreductase [Vibrionaceae bacterium]